MAFVDRMLPAGLKNLSKDSFVLEDWRLWLGQVMAWVFVFLFPLFCLAAFPIFIANQYYLLTSFYVFLWLFLVLRVCFPDNKFLASRYLWLVMLYTIAFSSFIALGPNYLNSAWLVFGSVLAALYLGTAAAIRSVVIYILALTIIYWAMDPDHPAWTDTFRLGLNNYLTFMIGTCLMCLGAGLPVGLLLGRLGRSLERQKAINQQLAAERAQLNQAHQELQREMRERALAQLALKESQEKLSLLADNLPNAMIYQVVAEPGGGRRFTYLSKSLERLNEITVEEVMADPAVLYGQVAPEYEEGLRAKEARALQNLTFFRHTIKAILPSGRERWFELAATPQAAPGDCVVWDGVEVDVTDREEARRALRESEELYRVLVETSHDGIVRLDDSFRITFVNEEFRTRMGYSQEELLGRDFREFLAPETSHLPVEHYLAKLQGESLPPRYEFLVLGKDGAKRWMEVRSSEMVDSKGEWSVVAQLLDITERREAEKALKQSESRYRALVEHSHAGIVLMDDSFCLDYVNDQFCRMLGYSRDELLGQDSRRLLAEETAELAKENYLARQRGENPPSRYEFMVLRRDGAKRWVEVSASVISNSDGAKQTVAQFLDVTERKKADMALRDSENLYRALVENTHDGVIIVDKSFRFIYVNDEFCRIMSYAREELLGQDFRDFLAEETRHIPTNHYLMRQRGEDAPSRYRFMIQRKDGTKRWVETNSTTFTDSKGNLRSVAQLLDITERQQAEKALRQSEEKFRQIIQASPMGVHMYELEEPERLALRGANPAADRILALDHQELMGQDIEEIFPGLRDTGILESFRQMAAQGGAWRNQELHYQDERLSGSYEVYWFKTAPGKLTVMFRDISGRKKAEEEKAQLESQLRQSQKMEAIGTLTGGIAHDFNNILGAILGTAEISLLKNSGADYLAGNMASIRDMSIRGRELVHRLLAFSRREDQAVRTFDMTEVVLESLELLKATMPAKVQIQKKLTPGLLVTADPTQIQQVIMNLCTNAAQAMEDGGGQLLVRVEPRELNQEEARLRPGLQAGPHVLLRVSDTGHGIKPGLLNRIFDPFFTTKPMGQGTGLGLSLAHGIVKSHQGDISAESQEGAGTTMSVLLPLASPETDAQAEPESVPAMDGKGEHILVVDDEEIIARSTAETLEALGYRVSVFTSPLEAAAALRQNPERFALVLTDNIMPGLTGRQLTEMAGELRPGLPVILMTGLPDSLGEADGSAQPILVLTKPVTITEVGQAVRFVLDRR